MSAANGGAGDKADAKAGTTPLLIRVLMIGDSSVGKTSLVLRYDKRGFNPKFSTTIGVDYSDRLLDLNGRQVKLQIWDTAGQERFHSLTTSFFKRAEGFVLVFDVSQRQSFESVSRWMRDITEQGRSESDVVICGNKCDLPTRQVTKEEAAKLADGFNVPYFETSAKENLNVDAVFDTLASKIKGRMEAQSAAEEDRAAATLRLGQPAGDAKEAAGAAEKSACC